MLTIDPDLNDSQASLLTIAQTYLQNIIAPQAEIIDQQPEALLQALQGMGELNLLALRIPQLWGGGGLSELEYHQFQVLITRYSGALAFLQTQHQSAASLIFTSNNEQLKGEYLPNMGKGHKLVGIAFSHLRRQGKPTLTATPVTDGYILQGIIPWITGWNFFEDVIIGATLPDGQALYGMIPLRELSDGNISFSQPMVLAVMTSTNTVSASINQLLLPSHCVLGIKPADAIHQNDRQNVLNQGFLALGCAFAALDIIERIYHQKQLSFIENAWQSLDQEVNHCLQTMLTAESSNLTDEQKLQLRAHTINLAARCSQAAVTVASGAANMLTHPAQRVYREALMFTVSGQTLAVMEATLKISSEYQRSQVGNFTNQMY